MPRRCPLWLEVLLWCAGLLVLAVWVTCAAP